MSKKEPEMLDHFEDFLSSVSHELKRTKAESSTLEEALKSRWAKNI
jgi:hypothetical protein